MHFKYLLIISLLILCQSCQHSKHNEAVVAEEKTPYIMPQAEPEEAALYISEPMYLASSIESTFQYSLGEISISQSQYNTEEYDLISENKFLDALNNPLSTFSIDVDTASYSNVRRFLNDSILPPKDAIRVEELINYFSYDYPEPTNGLPFFMNTELSTCPWNEKNQLLHIGLKGQSIKSESVQANNLVFLLDVSGSMSDSQKLPLLKQSFTLLVDQLTEKDRVSIVVYAGASGLILPSTPGSEKQTILNAINQLNAGGSTAGGQGIELAYQQAQKSLIKNGNNRIILATDGDFNVGVSSNAELVRLIETKRDEGIFLTILGFGMGNYKDSKMELLSNAGNGNYAYIDNIREANKVLVNDLQGTLFTIAKDVKIQVEFNPSTVKAYRLIGYENRQLDAEDFTDDKKDAGELGAGHTITALYEIIPADSEETIKSQPKLKYQIKSISNKAHDSDELLTLKLRYKQPNDDTSKKITKVIRNKLTEFKNTSDNFKFSAAVAEFGLLLRDSEFKANANFKQILELGNASKGKDKFGYRTEFLQLIESARLLHQNGKTN